VKLGHFIPSCLQLAGVAWGASTISALATEVSFTDVWQGVSAYYDVQGHEIIQTVAGAKVDISVPLTGVNIDDFDASTPFWLDMGTAGSAGSVYYGELGDDKSYRPGRTNVFLRGGLTVSWSPTNLIVKLAADRDILHQEYNLSITSYDSPSEDTGPFHSVYEVAVRLGGFIFDNRNIPVSGYNTETLYVLPPGVFNYWPGYPLPLESGWLKGSADYTLPTISFLLPAAPVTKVHSGATVIDLKGRTTDNVDVAALNLIVNGDSNNPIALDEQKILPTKNLAWSASFDLGTNADARFGSNIVTVIASDTSGNQSSASRTFVWVKTNSANVTVNPPGAGTVAGLRTGQSLQENFAYLVTAKPANKNWIFAGWTDSQSNLLSDNLSFDYTDTDGQLTANFAANPFGQNLAGVYAGLFTATNDVSTTNSGYIAISVSSNGVYSGHLTLGQKSLALSGQLTFLPLSGVATNECLLKLSASETLAVSLQITVDTNLADVGAGAFVGSVTAVARGNSVNSLWSSTISGGLTSYVAGAHKSGGVLQYHNVVLEQALDDADSTGPAGYSYGIATAHPNGEVTWVMNLADGISPPMTFSSYQLLDGRLLFYAAPYGGKGLISGYVRPDAGWMADAVVWSKPVGGARFYPEGFSIFLDSFSLYYQAPTPNQNTLGWTQSEFKLGPMQNPLAVGVFFDTANNTILSDAPSPNELLLDFNPVTGLVSGSYQPPLVAKATPFHALFLGRAAYGFCLTTNYQTAPVTIGPASFPPVGGHVPPP
jgi:hypothetical protein